MNVNFGREPVNTGYQSPVKKEEGLLKRIWKTLFSSKLEKQVENLNNPLVNRVWKQVKQREIDETEINFLTSLQNTLGEIDLSDEEIKNLHQFIHKDKEGLENLQKYLDEVNHIRKENITLLKSEKFPILIASPKTEKLMNLMVEATVPLGAELSHLLFILLDRVFPANSQVITDTMILAIDKNESSGTEGRNREQVNFLEKNKKNYSLDQQVLIHKGFLTRSNSLNGIWQKANWVREKGEDLGGGKAVFEKGYVEIMLAIPGKDYVKVQTQLDLTSLGSLEDAQNNLVFKAIADFGTKSSETAEKDIRNAKDQFNFLDENQFETLINIAKEFTDRSLIQLTAALLAVGSKEEVIPGVTRDLKELEIGRILLSVGSSLKENEASSVEQALNTVSKDEKTFELVKGFIDDCSRLESGKNDKLLKQTIEKMGKIAESVFDQDFDEATVNTLSSFLQRVVHRATGE